jgi:nucleoside 2-deoxyribosyltransferase
MKSVVICGSGRFKKEVREFANKLIEMGIVVYYPYFHGRDEEWEKLSDYRKNFVALGLTHDHFYKIRMADVVFIYNKDGYSGNSTTLEMGFALALGKPLYAFSDQDEELCRNVMFREIVKTPAKLAKLLK